MRTRPKSLYRYRPLNEELFDREIDALRRSYLFAPSFSEMNDPMEAFYESGGSGERLIDTSLLPFNHETKEIYSSIEQMAKNLALVSFSTTRTDLAMWAYYATNFSGICLEFDTDTLASAGFEGETLNPVTYSTAPLPSLNLVDMRNPTSIVERISQKRVEWQHEKEWRFLVGKRGPKHYIDEALTRVHLGPRIDPRHAARICDVLKYRPAEIVQLKITGFNITFETIKQALPFKDCDRVGTGRFDLPEDLDDDAREKIAAFLATPIEVLIEECRRLATSPSMEKFQGIYTSGENVEAIYVWTAYKLRSGREVNLKRYFDRNMSLISP